MAWKGVADDNAIWWSTYDPASDSWAGQKQVRGVGTSDGPALAFIGTRLFMFWKGVPGDSNAYWSWMDPAGDPVWRPQRLIEYTNSQVDGIISLQIGTSNSLSATSRGNDILLAWKGVQGDSGIYWSTL